ncbi:MAG: hypothetical protein Fur0037_08880 [Planctomycetota bacterium]
MALAEMPGVSTTYTTVPLEGLAGPLPLEFPLYLETRKGTFVLYRDRDVRLDEEQVGRLEAEGVRELHVCDSDRILYFRRVESSLDEILRNGSAPIERRVDILWGVAQEMAEDLLVASPDRGCIARARRVMLATSGLLLRDSRAFQAVRKVLSPGSDLRRHSLTVGFLCMGLAREALAAEPNALLEAGLAGLLHDVGRAGHEQDGADQEHVVRGSELLRTLGLPASVCEGALLHHERFDGSGYPKGLSGAAIPEMARLVALVDTFDKVHSGQHQRVGVFDALRIMAQAYCGCFDERMVPAFVRLFRA